MRFRRSRGSLANFGGYSYTLSKIPLFYIYTLYSLHTKTLAFCHVFSLYLELYITIYIYIFEMGKNRIQNQKVCEKIQWIQGTQPTADQSSEFISASAKKLSSNNFDIKLDESHSHSIISFSLVSSALTSMLQCKMCAKDDILYKHKSTLTAEVQEYIKPVFEKLTNNELLTRPFRRKTLKIITCYNKTLGAIIPKHTFIGCDVLCVCDVLTITHKTMNELPNSKKKSTARRRRGISKLMSASIWSGDYGLINCKC